MCSFILIAKQSVTEQSLMVISNSSWNRCRYTGKDVRMSLASERNTRPASLNVLDCLSDVL